MEMPTGDAVSLSSFHEKEVHLKLKKIAVVLTEGQRCQYWPMHRDFRILATLSSDLFPTIPSKCTALSADKAARIFGSNGHRLGTSVDKLLVL